MRETHLLPRPPGQFFQIHGSKLKLRSVRYLGQASLPRITHARYSVNFYPVSRCVQQSRIAPVSPKKSLPPAWLCLSSANNRLISSGSSPRQGRSNSSLALAAAVFHSSLADLRLLPSRLQSVVGLIIFLLCQSVVFLALGFSKVVISPVELAWRDIEVVGVHD